MLSLFLPLLPLALPRVVVVVIVLLLPLFSRAGGLDSRPARLRALSSPSSPPSWRPVRLLRRLSTRPCRVPLDTRDFFDPAWLMLSLGATEPATLPWAVEGNRTVLAARLSGRGMSRAILTSVTTDAGATAGIKSAGVMVCAADEAPDDDGGGGGGLECREMLPEEAELAEERICPSV